MTDIYVNFKTGAGAGAAAPWSYNEFSTHTAGVLSSDLKDDANVSTGFSLEIVSAFGGSAGGGTTATSGAGGWPENTFDYAFYSNATPLVRVGNLNSGDSYTVEVAGHAANSARDTDFTVDGTTTRYDSAGTGVPNAPISFSGTVSGTTLDISTAVVSTFAYFNGFKITITPSASLTIDSEPTEVRATESFSIVVSTPTTAPTTGNTTGNLNGLTGIAPTSVTGSDPYTLNFTLPRTTAKYFSATGYTFDIDINGETASTGTLPYLPATGFDYVLIDRPNLNTEIADQYSGLEPATGDQAVWEVSSDPDGSTVGVRDDLTWLFTPQPTQDQTSDFYIVYQTESAVGPLDTITWTAPISASDLTAMVSAMVSNMVTDIVK